MHTVKLLISLVGNHQVLAYVVIFIGLIFEGEVVLLSTGILAHLGAVNFIFALLFVLGGGFLKTFFGYRIGLYIRRNFSETKLIRYLEHRVNDVMPRFSERPFWSIFISKFIMGLNHIVIIFSGYKQIAKRIYFKAEVFSTIVWAPLLLSLGYFFSYTALNVSREIWRFSLIVLLLVIGYIILDKVLGFMYEIFEEIYEQK